MDAGNRQTGRPEGTLYLIGNAHLDPIWLWRWPQGLAEVKATFLSALARMREFPGFTFTCSSAMYYAWAEENVPEMFAEIRQRVEEGRWCIVGGWWIQPDCNIPCGEAFVRQGLYAQRYFLEKFGRMARTGYNVDSFGHHQMLPQILAKSGMTNYVFMRPSPDEKDLPGCLFWWESPDGSRVLTFRIPLAYNQEWGDPNNPDPTEKQKLIRTRELQAELGYDLMGFYGVGNHGGGPTIANLNLIQQLQAEWGANALKLSSPDEYFEHIRDARIAPPVVRDELQHHASGVYAAHSGIKKINRRAEQRLMMSEKFCAVAQGLGGLETHPGRFERAWKLVLLNHFHDVITGCAIKEACDDALHAYGEALHIAEEAMNAALQKISWSIDTTGGETATLSKESDWILWEHADKGAPLVVFNPLSWEVSVPVQVHRKVSGIADAQGRPQALQPVRAPQMNLDDKWDTLFIAQIPAMGYAVYRIFRNAALTPDVAPGGLSISAGHIENAFLRLEFDSRGYIARIYDKRLGADMLSGPGAVPVVIDETDADTWAHFIFAFDKELGRFDDAESEVLENGPLRVRLRVTNRFGASTLRQDFLLYHDRPEVVVQVKLDWRERHRMLKLAFPVHITAPRIRNEIPYGFIERAPGGLEEPMQMWVDLGGIHPETGGVAGLALLNDAKYGFSAKDQVLNMTVARSPIYADHYGYAERDAFCDFMDQGEQEFTYIILPHGEWRTAGIEKKAWELNAPVSQILETYHPGPRGLRMESIRILAENVIAPVFKIGEDGDAYILRCHEIHGETVEASISLPFLDRQWRSTFGPCEIKTFRIPFDPEQGVSETSLIEREVRP